MLVEDEEPRQLGAIAEAAAATREVPAQLAAAFRKLAATGALQRRWDCLVARAEASSDTGEGALLSALLGLLDDAAGVAAHLLEAREILIRQRAEGVSQERRTLDWVVRESSMDSPHQTTPASSIERVGTQ